MYAAAHAVGHAEPFPAAEATLSLGRLPAGVADPEVAARSARVCRMLAGIWLLSGLDYMFTVTALAHDLIDELNPLAVYVYRWGEAPLLCYKIVLLTLVTAGLAARRQLRLVELLTAGVLAALVLVAIRWGGLAALYGYMLALAPPGYPLA